MPIKTVLGGISLAGSSSRHRLMNCSLSVREQNRRKVRAAQETSFNMFFERCVVLFTQRGDGHHDFD
jgi:hypothetical protein